MRRWGRLAALCALLAASSAHAGRRTPDAVDDALAWATTDRTKAIAVLEAAWASLEGTEDGPIVALHAGEQHRLAGNGDQAHLWFTRALQGDGQPGGELGLALVASQRGVTPALLAVLEQPTEKQVTATQNADRFLLLAVRAAGQNDAPRVAQYSRKALAYGREDPAVFSRITAELGALTGGPDAGEPKGALEKAEAAFAEGRTDDARRHAEAARAGASPGSPEALAAEGLLRRLSGAPVVPGRIAVLLPLSGKFEAVGRQVREAFEHGWTQAGGGSGLVFVDSGADAASAAAAVEKAALEEGAVAIVGPLLSDGAESAAAAADQLHVPLVSLSQGLDEPERFGWVYQAAVTPRQQIEGLVGYLTTTKGLTRFGIFAPDDDYGQHAAAVFTEIVQGAGGTIAAQASYDAEANVVTEAAAALARADSPKDNLEYDALFLPDTARRIPLACAGLAFEEFPLGTFVPHPKIRPIPLVGLNGYNSTQLVTAGNEYVRGSFFTDVFVPGGVADRPAMAEFTASFKQAFGRTPTSLEAAAADTGRLVATAASGAPASREAFRTALLAARPTGTATGVVGVDAQDHTLDREVLLLTIARGGIAVVATLPPE